MKKKTHKMFTAQFVIQKSQLQDLGKNYQYKALEGLSHHPIVSIF